MGSAASIRAETTTVAASSTSEPLPEKRSSRKVSAASGGVCPRAWCPSGRAWLLPSSWPPWSLLEGPRRHQSSVESMAGRFADWKRAQASFRTRPRSLWSLMLLAAGLREA